MSMMIELKDRATDGKINIPKGKYTATMNSFTGEVMLVGSGKDYKCQATRRRAKVNNTKLKTTSMTFYAAGANQWSLLISDPKTGEWILMLELGKDAEVKGQKEQNNPQAKPA